MAPNEILLYSLSVAFRRIALSGPFVNVLKPSSKVIIPNNRIDTPAAIVLKLGLKNKTIARMIRTIRKIHLLIIKLIFNHKHTNYVTISQPCVKIY